MLIVYYEHGTLEFLQSTAIELIIFHCFRYKIPGGLTAAPDDTCSTYFASETVQNMEEFQHQLEKKASADAKLFGFKFSGSYSHEETSIILNSGEYKIVLSNAECHYYSTSLNIYSLPPFSKEVVSWLEKFNNTIGSQAQYELILTFMDYFGTHVPVKMIYGASYTNVDKLTNENYKSLEQKGSPSVNTQASFASLFSIDSTKPLPDSQTQQTNY